MLLPWIEWTHWEWWYRTDGRSTTLHLLPDLVDDPALYERTRDTTGRLRATAICGETREWSPPGLFSRSLAPRCGRCSRAVGLPSGRGPPRNDRAVNP